jgi:hypothetical protein
MLRVVAGRLISSDWLDTVLYFSFSSFAEVVYSFWAGERPEFSLILLKWCALSGQVGSLMGSSPIAAFIESASGIREGGRTGLTAICVSLWFFVALFFTPILCAPPSPEPARLSDCFHVPTCMFKAPCCLTPPICAYCACASAQGLCRLLVLLRMCVCYCMLHLSLRDLFCVKVWRLTCTDG